MTKESFPRFLELVALPAPSTEYLNAIFGGPDHTYRSERCAWAATLIEESGHPKNESCLVIVLDDEVSDCGSLSQAGGIELLVQNVRVVWSGARYPNQTPGGPRPRQRVADLKWFVLPPAVP